MPEQVDESIVNSQLSQAKSAIDAALATFNDATMLAINRERNTRLHLSHARAALERAEVLMSYEVQQEILAGRG